MRKITLSLLFSGLVLFTTKSFSQSSANYTPTTGTNASLVLDMNSNAVNMSSGTTELVGGNSDDVASSVYNIGFDFWLQGTRYSQFSASSNGIIRLGGTAISSTSFQMGLSGQALISPFGGDLMISNSGQVDYKLVGTAPNRALVIEFNGMSLDYTSGSKPNDGTFQVRLYETTGVIEFVYGAMYRNSSGANTGSFNIGFSSTTGSGNIMSYQTSDWSYLTDGTVTINTYTTSSNISDLNSASDGSRRYIRFTPPTTSAPTNLSFTSVTTNSMTLNWTNNGSNRVVTAVYRSTDNSTFTYIGTATSAATSYNATGLTAGTTYYWKLYSVSEGYVSSELTGNQATQAGGLWLGTTSTNWSTGSNWSDGAAPTSSTDVIIPSGTTYSPSIGTSTVAVCRNLTINSGAVLTIGNTTAGGGSFDIYGNVSNEGSIYHTSDLNTDLMGSGKTFGGSGNFAYNNEFVSFNIATGASYTLSSDITLLNQLRISTLATFSLSSYTLSVFTFSFDAGTINLNTGTLEIGDAIDYTAGTLNVNTGTVYFNSGDSKWVNSGYPADNQTINGFSYYNLKVRTNNGVVATLGTGSSYTVSNTLELLNPGTAGGVATTANNIICNGSFNLGTSGNGLTLNLGHSIYRSTGSGSTTFTMGNNDNHNINITYVSSTYTALDMGASASTINLTLYGTVTYNSSSATVQRIIPNTYKNLTIAGSGTGKRNLLSALTINGDLTISTTNTGQLDATTSNYGITLSGNWINSGTSDPFNARSSTVTLSGTGTKYINVSNTTPAISNIALSLYNVTIGGSDIRLYNNDQYGVTINGVLTVNASSGLYVYNNDGASANDYGISAYGNIVNNGTIDNSNNDFYHSQFNTTSISGTGSFVDTWLNSRGTVTISDNFTFSSLLVDASRTISIASNKTVASDKYSGYGGSIANYGTLTMNTGSVLTLQGTFTNSGTFNRSTGQVTFNGITNQSLTGTTAATFYNLEISNAAGVTINTSATADNSVIFTNGDFTTATSKYLIFDADAAVSGVSNSSHVNGSVQKQTSTISKFTFPVGDGTSYRSIAVTPSNTNSTTWTSNYVTTPHSDVTVTGVVNHISGEEYWNLDRSGVTPANATIELSWNVNSGADANYTELVVAHYNGTDWETAGGNSHSGNSSAGTVASNANWSSYSPFTLGSTTVNNPLPVTLISFSASGKVGNVELKWITASEINNDYFTIEKTTDGLNFETVGTVNGAGTKSSTSVYSLTDYTPFDGISYYRLKQTDFDGEAEYSSLVEINRNNTNIELKAYSNYSSGNLELTVENSTSGAYNLVIVDNYGKIVHNQTLKLNEGNNMLYVPLNYSSGIYYVSIYNDQFTLNQKLIW